MPRPNRGRAKRVKKEKPVVRYAFYTITIIIIAVNVLLIALYNAGSVSATAVTADSSMALSLLFPSAVFSYLLAKGQNLKKIITDLGLSRDKLNSKSIMIGLALFALIVLMELLLGAFSAATGVQLPTNVSALLTGMPAYFLAFTFIIAPIDEEILFRGFMVPRLGIITSALLFAVLHLTYLSVSQFVAAFVFGLLAGYSLRENKSLYSTILAHALVNFLTIAIMFL